MQVTRYWHSKLAVLVGKREAKTGGKILEFVLRNFY
jgi:hypothetical protein